MRKILLIILIVLLLVGAGFTIINGFEIGNFQVWGIKGIQTQNEVIENKNQELSGLVGVTYLNTLETLNTSSKTLTSTKEEYENKAVLVSNSKYYMQTEKYEIDFLWTKLGNYAKDNKVQIKIDVVNSSTSKLYDLKFTLAGEYANIIEFLYDVENDSRLGFKIEEFHMSAVDGGVQGTFSCKEIGINIEMTDTGKNNNSDEQEDVTEDNNSSNEETVENTSNTTNTTINSVSNTTTNTTNSISSDMN